MGVLLLVRGLGTKSLVSGLLKEETGFAALLPPGTRIWIAAGIADLRRL